MRSASAEMAQLCFRSTLCFRQPPPGGGLETNDYIEHIFAVDRGFGGAKSIVLTRISPDRISSWQDRTVSGFVRISSLE